MCNQSRLTGQRVAMNSELNFFSRFFFSANDAVQLWIALYFITQGPLGLFSLSGLKCSLNIGKHAFEVAKVTNRSKQGMIF